MPLAVELGRREHSRTAEFGAWWAARDAVDVEVAESGGDRLVTLTVPQKIAGLGLSLVATVYPSWSASRVNPAEALRYE